MPQQLFDAFEGCSQHMGYRMKWSLTMAPLFSPSSSKHLQGKACSAIARQVPAIRKQTAWWRAQYRQPSPYCARQLRLERTHGWPFLRTRGEWTHHQSSDSWAAEQKPCYRWMRSTWSQQLQCQPIACSYSCDCTSRRNPQYDQSHGTKELPELNSGDIVRVRPMLVGQQEWEEAIVVEKLSEPRSYNVWTRTGILRRNRRDLVKQRGEESEPAVEPSGERRTLPKDQGGEGITEEAQSWARISASNLQYADDQAGGAIHQTDTEIGT